MPVYKYLFIVILVKLMKNKSLKLVQLQLL